MKSWYKSFKNWMNYNCPYSATIDEWEEFGQDFKSKAPVRYFLCRAMPRLIRRGIVWPLERAVGWVRYRLVRYHIVDSGLGPGYVEGPELMLATNFAILTNFVQHILPQTMSSFDSNGHIKTWKRYLPWFSEWGLSEERVGIEYLEHGIAQEEENHAEILELYIWWVYKRPARQLPPEPVFENEYNPFSIKYKTKHREEYLAYKAYVDIAHKLEDEWAIEDDKNLLRLINIRHELQA